MRSNLIENVPRIAMFVGNSSYLTPFIGSLYAILQSLGRKETYSEILALSGAGNRLRWAKGWDPSNVDILQCEEPAFTPHFRALNAMGLDGAVRLIRPISGQEGPFVDEATARREIITSIDGGIPVIAMGVIGPPECCVVCGYDDGGDALMGWNYFQTDEGFDPEQLFRKHNWLSNTWGYIILKPSGVKPSLRDSGLIALKAIVQHARTESVRGAAVGLVAWEALLNQLEFDEFPPQYPLHIPKGSTGGDEVWQNSAQGRLFIYCDALCQIHERGIALPCFEKLAEEVPEWSPELKAAIGFWRECSNYGGFIWHHLANDDAGLLKFREPAIRKILADEGRRCMDLERQAIEQIESLLARINE